MRWEPTAGASHWDIVKERTADGGYTQETLAKWGVPWPPPHGWKKAVIRKWKMDRRAERLRGSGGECRRQDKGRKG